MKKMLSAVAVMLSIAFAVPALGQTCDPKKDPTCCDPKKQICGGEDCSVGWFKNHTDEWFGLDCGGTAYSDDQLLACINEKGPGSGIVREFCRQILVACVGEAGVRQCAE